MTHVCYSGGSKGADQLFGELAAKARHDVFHWSFQGHHSRGTKETTYVLPAMKLAEANRPLIEANNYLNRNYPTRSEYVNNLLRRNYYQVKDSERIYAVCNFTEDMIPLGGTAWAIVMGANLGITEMYVFDQDRKEWFTLDQTKLSNWPWTPTYREAIPMPFGRYAGIGKSELNKAGADAIKSLYTMEWN